MNEKTKESKFLDAINRYAESQKAKMTREIEDYKNAKIEQATEQGLQDAYELIRSDISRRKAAIVCETAERELALHRALFEERTMIENAVFDASKDRIIAFRQSEKYDCFLKKSAESIAELFDGEEYTVYTAPFDVDKHAFLSKSLTNAVFVTDRQIQLGGLRAYCPALNISADDTLDTRLNDQREWFIENAGLKVV